MAARDRYRYDQLDEPQEPKSIGLRKSSTRLPISSGSARGHHESQKFSGAPLGAKIASIKPQQLQRIQSPHGRTTTTSPLGSYSGFLPDVPRAHASIEDTTRPRQLAASLMLPIPSSRNRTSNKTPSLISGSTLTGPDSPRSVLRRKPSTIDQYVTQTRTDPESLQDHQELLTTTRKPSHVDDPFPGAIFGISLPPASAFVSKTIPDCNNARATTRPSDFARKTQGSRLHTLQPALPLQDISATSSSRYSGSPFSHISTPTSASSYSSHIVKGDDISAPGGRNRSSAVEDANSRGEVHDHDIPPHTFMNKELSHHQTANVQERTRQVPTRKPVPSSMEGSGAKALVMAPYVSPDTQAVGSKAQSQPQGIRIPPELAHLNVDLPVVQSPAKGFPPRRPSREGMADLNDWRGNLTVVESNLPASYNSRHRRTPSLEIPVPLKSSTLSSTRNLFGFSSRSSSRQGSPRVDSAVSSPPLTRSLSEVMDAAYNGTRSHIDTPIRSSPIVETIDSSVKSSRLGFFPRRPKEKTEKPEREQKRGPAAGTGHEGYGRFGFRGRSGSFFGSTGRSSSSDSSTSSRTTSPFRRRKSKSAGAEESSIKDILMETGNPTSLQGHSSYSRLLTTTGGNKPPIDFATEKLRSEFEPSSYNVTAQLPPRLSPQKQRPAAIKPSHDASIDEPPIRKSTRSTQGRAFTDGKEGHWLRAVKSTPHAGPLKHSNFSQRVRAIDRYEADVNRYNPIAPEASTLDLTYGSLAHYVLAGPSTAVGLRELGQLMTQSSQPSNDSTVPVNIDGERQTVVPFERRHESFLPAPPYTSEISPNHTSPPTFALRTDSSESPQLLQAQMAKSAKSPHLVDINRLSAQQRLSSVSAPRLSSVGRIPAVVSRKDQDRKFPNHSFSQPLAQTHPRPTLTQMDLAISIKRASSTKRQKSFSSMQPPHMVASASSATGVKNEKFESHTSAFDQTKHSKDDFLAFPERKNSDLSYTSSSGIASPCCDTGRQSFFNGEDEVWNEYNDLINEVMPVKRPVSAGSSMGAPFQFAETFSEQRQEPAIHGVPRTLPDLKEQFEGLLPVTGLSDDTDDIPHRFSQFLQPANTPSTPFSISDYLVGYGDRTSKILEPVLRLSAPDGGDETKTDATRLSLPASRGKQSLDMSTSVPNPETTDPDAKYATSVESTPQSSPPAEADVRRTRTRTQVVAVTGELRFAALMTSKWLSFGRVLFSPAHGEAKTDENARVLILDGLGKGNKTCSLLCCL